MMDFNNILPRLSNEEIACRSLVQSWGKVHVTGDLTPGEFKKLVFKEDHDIRDAAAHRVWYNYENNSKLAGYLYKDIMIEFGVEGWY